MKTETYKNYRAAEVKLIYKTSIAPECRTKICCSADAFKVLWESWDKETLEHHESFKVLLLNNTNDVLGIADISNGGTAGTVIDAKIIFQYAIKAHASSLILAHNHPSSHLVPSEADIEVTKKLMDAGKVLDLKILDHLIISADQNYLSMADDGKT